MSLQTVFTLFRGTVAKTKTEQNKYIFSNLCPGWVEREALFRPVKHEMYNNIEILSQKSNMYDMNWS